MSDVIIVAIITAAASIVSNLIIVRKTNRESDVKRAVEQQIVNDRLDALERKIDIHNGYAEKFGEIQKDIAVLATEIKNLKGA